MARILVPDDHASITQAVAAATSGDVVIVRAGTYVEDEIDLPTTGIGVRAEANARVVVDASAGAYAFKMQNTSWLRGLTILAGSSYGVRGQASTGSTYSVFDCTIVGGPIGIGQLGTGSRVARCTVTDSTDTGIQWTSTVTPVVESCVLYDIAGAYGIFGTTGTVAHCTVANSTFVNYGISVTSGTVRNCIAQDNTGRGIRASTYTTNNAYNNSTSNYPSSTPSGNFAVDSQFRDASRRNYALKASSPLRAAGTVVAPFPADRYGALIVSSAGTASSSHIGAIAGAAPKTYLSAHHRLLTKAILSIKYPTSGTTYLPTMDATSCRGAPALARMADYAIGDLLGPDVLRFELLGIGNFALRAYTGTNFDVLAVDAVFAALTGTETATNKTFDLYGQDAYALLTSARVHLEDPSYDFSGRTEAADTGKVYSTVPSGTTVRKWAIDGLSSATSAYEDVPSALVAFSRGIPVRVYPEWPNITSKWSEDNPLGFIDVVYDASDFDTPWVGEVMRRFSYRIEGFQLPDEA